MRDVARARIGKRIGNEAAAALRATTAGWVAGTVLLLESRRVAPRCRPANAAPEQLLFDYFAAEILGSAPLEAQRLLVATAILPQIDVSAAEVLTAEPGAGQILADLARRNFFTHRLDGSRSRYRLHPLFREFLLSRAKATLDADSRRALAHRAADLLIGSGDADGAATILQEAGLREDLARLVHAHAPMLAAQGRLASLEAWLRSLPESALDSDPWLSYWMGVCRSESPAEARRWFEAAHRAFRKQGDTTGTLVSWAGAVSTFCFPWDEFTGLDPWIEEMEGFRAASSTFPSIEVEAQVTFGMFTSLMLRAPSHPSMDYWLDRATVLLDSGVRSELRVLAASNVSMYWLLWRGDHARAERGVEKLREMVETPGVRDLTKALWYAGEAHLRARRGDHAGCLTAAEHGLAFARKTGVLVTQGVLETQGIYGGLYAGDLNAARRLPRARTGAQR
jgi:hypothetical protein